MLLLLPLLVPALAITQTPAGADRPLRLAIAGLTHGHVDGFLRAAKGRTDVEIAGVYEDPDKTLHVFARTPHVPHIYYYRCRKGTTQTWTPWERLDLDIQSDHLIPVVWNRRLMLIWPVFTEKAEESGIEMPGPGETMPPAGRYWTSSIRAGRSR